MSRTATGGVEIPLLACGAALVAMLAAMPAAMSLSTTRGFVLMKFAIGLPLACAAALAATWMFRFRRQAFPKSATSTLEILAILALFTAILVSTALANPQRTALLGGYFRLEGALAWLAYLGAYVATRLWIRSGGAAVVLVDTMLIAAIVPACYAIEQRFGLDFVKYTYGDPTRSAGTLGNPMFMGAYLAMCLPLTLARMGMSITTARHRLVLGIIGLLMFGGLLATRGRSPLLASLAAFGFLACVQACRQGRRAWLVGMLAGGLGLIASLAAINLTETGRSFAGGTPVLARLVYDAQGQDAATRSVHGRLAAWTAGEAALRAAPGWRTLTGFGADVAHEQFYAYMPADKIRAEDFRREQVTDRVHADLIDTAAALGMPGVAAIVGLLILALQGLVTGALGGTQRSGILCLAAGGGGAIVAWSVAGYVGAGALRWPLAGIVFVAGWLLAAALAVWHAARPGGRERDDGHLVHAGAGAALLAFWIDAQVGLPVFVTRMGFFVLLAIVLTPSRKAEPLASSITHQWLGAIGFVAAWMSAVTGILPSFGAGEAEGTVNSLFARLLPALALLALGRWQMSDTQHRRDSAGWKWNVLIGLAVIIAALRYHVALPSSDDDWIIARTVAEGVLPLSLWVIPLLAAWAGSRLARQSASRLVLAMLVGISTTAWPIWRLTEANVAGAGSTRVDKREREVRLNMLRATLAAAPWEWQYRYALVFEALPAASSEVVAGFPDAASYARFRRYTELAETIARDGLVEGSPDPWRPFLLGVVRQVRGLNVVSSVDPHDAARASTEADNRFGTAHRLFPVHPLILEHWIALKFDRGEIEAGFSLIDRMEEIIPAEPDPYRLRLLAGKRHGLRDQQERALNSAKKHLKNKELQRFLDVAN